MTSRLLSLCAALPAFALSVSLRAQSPSYPATQISGLISTNASGNSAAALGDGLLHATPSSDAQSVYLGSSLPGPDTAQASGMVSAGFGTLRTSLSATAQYATGLYNYQATASATIQFYDRIQFNNPDLAPYAQIDVIVSLGLSETHALAAVAGSNFASASILSTQTFRLGAFGDNQIVNPYFTLTNSESAVYDSLHGLAAGDAPTFYDSVTYHFQNGVIYSFTGILDTSIVANARMTAGGSFASATLDASHTGLVGFDILTAGSSYITSSNAGYRTNAAESAIPEPSTYAAVLGLGALGLTRLRRRPRL